MLWIQIVIFLLVAGGTMTLLNVNFKDFFQLAARGKPSTLKDDLDAIEATYRRMMTLAKRKYNMADDILMQIMVEAYPIVVFTKQLEDGSRKVMQIIEGEDYLDGRLIYRPLYQFDVTDNQTDAQGHIKVVGRHRKLGYISESLKKRFLDNGISAAELQPFINHEEEL